MTDLLPTIIPKSDQLNADDLIGRSLTITVEKVALSGAADQPIVIHYEGDNGHPYKPCKSMRRVMVQLWGSDGNFYAGRRMTLYRDDKVQFGGLAVGGIRISHMSHIEGAVTMALTATRGSRKPFVVQPLAEVEERRPAPANGRQDASQRIEALIDDAIEHDAFAKAWGETIRTEDWKRLKATKPDRAKALIERATSKAAELKS